MNVCHQKLSRHQPAHLFTKAVCSHLLSSALTLSTCLSFPRVEHCFYHLCVPCLRRKKVVMMNVSVQHSCPRASCWCFSLPAATRSVFTPFKAQLWLLLSTNLQENPTPALLLLLCCTQLSLAMHAATFPPACNTDFNIKWSVESVRKWTVCLWFIRKNGITGFMVSVFFKLV